MKHDLETLARFRPDMSLLDELGAIEGKDDFLTLGTVPAEWLRTRRVGRAALTGQYADIYSSGWVAYLRRKLASDALQVDIHDIDVAVLQQAAPRLLTQKASRTVLPPRKSTKLNGWVAALSRTVEHPNASSRTTRVWLGA